MKVLKLTTKFLAVAVAACVMALAPARTEAATATMVASQICGNVAMVSNATVNLTPIPSGWGMVSSSLRVTNNIRLQAAPVSTNILWTGGVLITVTNGASVDLAGLSARSETNSTWWTRRYPLPVTEKTLATSMVLSQNVEYVIDIVNTP